MIGLIFFISYGILVAGFFKYAEIKLNNFVSVNVPHYIIAKRKKKQKEEQSDLIYIRLKVTMLEIERRIFEEELEECRREVAKIKSEAETKEFTKTKKTSDSDKMDMVEA